MKAIEDLTKLMGQVQAASEKAFNQAITPELMQNMTDEQKELVNQGRNAFNLNGLTLEEKINELQNTLKNVANVNK